MLWLFCYFLQFVHFTLSVSLMEGFSTEAGDAVGNIHKKPMCKQYKDQHSEHFVAADDEARLHFMMHLSACWTAASAPQNHMLIPSQKQHFSPISSCYSLLFKLFELI